MPGNSKVQEVMRERVIEALVGGENLTKVSIRFGIPRKRDQVICYVSGPNPAVINFEIGRVYGIAEIWALINQQQGA